MRATVGGSVDVLNPEMHGRNPLAMGAAGTQAAQYILSQKTRIIMTWESEVREQIAAAEGNSSFVLSQMLPEFLDGMARVLVGELPIQELLAVMARVHGHQRAGIPGYFLEQLLKEFSILRAVIHRKLADAMPTEVGVDVAVDRVIDSAISVATTEFARVQSEVTDLALKRAESSNRDLEHFAAIAAHDLKSPLATISGFLSLFEEEFGPTLGGDGIKYVKFMTRAADRMRQLIDRLLDYARLSNADLSFQKVSTDQVVRASLQNLAQTLVQSGAVVHFERLPTISGDANLLTQLFQNLLANAIKFQGPEVPEISILAESQGDTWLFSVRDNGKGFDPALCEDIFALYKKLDRQGNEQGAGIGLATCRKVVERHGGKIWATSQLGLGSTFYFSLPQINDNPESNQHVQ